MNKKTFFKRLTALLLVLLMAIAAMSMVACQKDKEDDDDDDDEKPKTESSQHVAERNEFIDGLGGVSETYVGAISEDSYSSAEDAAEAYVAEEIAGESNANIVEVTSKGELSDKEIAKANIPADLIAGCDAVEEMEVVYELEDESSLENGGVEYLASSSSKKATVKVYVIKFNVDWKYFTPMPETGDTISKSYYDSVFNAESYKNCTLESTTVVDIEIKADGETMTMTSSITQKVMHSEGKVYFEQISKSSSNGQETPESYICAYIEEGEYGVECYVKTSATGPWQYASLYQIGFSSIEELTPFYNAYLDYTYFTKTDYGFALADENARAYFTQALMGALGSMSSMIDEDKMKLDMYAEYYVAEGVLSGCRVDADVDMDLSVEGQTASLKEKVNTVTKCTNYGSTVIERPDVD